MFSSVFTQNNFTIGESTFEGSKCIKLWLGYPPFISDDLLLAVFKFSNDAEKECAFNKAFVLRGKLEEFRRQWRIKHPTQKLPWREAVRSLIEQLGIGNNKHSKPKEDTKPKVITEAYINDIINRSDCEFVSIGDRAAILKCVLPNNYVIVTNSSCTSDKEYDESIARNICMKKLKEKIFELEAYRFQCEISK